MTTLRRRILRPSSDHDPNAARLRVSIEKRERQLESERTALDRWMKKLRRAFHAIERHQRRVAGLQRTLSRLRQG